DALPGSVPDEHETSLELLRKLLEPALLGALARDREQETGLGGPGARAYEHLESLFRCQTTDGEDDDVVRRRPQSLPQLRAAGCELVRTLAELLDVDGVGEDTDAVRGSAARDHGVAGQRSGHEHSRRAADERRDHGSLERAPPVRAGSLVVALDDEHVGDPLEAGPGD